MDRIAGPVLFLDFDGVLHPDPPNSTAPLFCRAHVLHDWLEHHPEVSVVISSTWRLSRSLQQLQALFAEWGDRIIDMTPDIPSADYQRQHECDAWMREHAQPWATWVALDDRAWNFRPFERRLVLTDRATGLVAQDLLRLDSMAL